jgi:D-alanine-D-alanine ligase-like ATP-grasp enzyme
MHVCILSDEESKDFNPAPFIQGHSWEMVTMHPPVMETIHSAAARNVFDVYLNLCEGEEGDDAEYTGLEVIQALEALNLPFTGADSKTYDPTREEMQAAADANGLRFARGLNITQPEMAEALVVGLRYPLMVKHPQSFGSAGMTRDSRVESPAKLREQVQRTCSEFGSARVEEFIEGREFTCLVVDNPDDLKSPYAYPPAEMIFPDGETFQHVDVKWFNFNVKIVPVEDDALRVRVQDIGVKMYQAMGGIGYGRTDMRLNADGELVILEINPNCGIFLLPEELGPADFPMDFDPGGHAGFLERIFRVAILRQKMRAEKA